MRSSFRFICFRPDISCPLSGHRLYRLGLDLRESLAKPQRPQLNPTIEPSLFFSTILIENLPSEPIWVVRLDFMFILWSFHSETPQELPSRQLFVP